VTWEDDVRPRRASAAFSARKQRDADSGLEVLVLRYNDGRSAANDLEVRILPDAGSNLYWLTVGGEQLLEQPLNLGVLATSPAGTPILFPSPNRVRDATFTFEGRRFDFEPNSGPNFIHGLVRRRPWRAAEPVAGPMAALASVAVDWDERQPEFQRFPVVHRLTMKYELRRRSLRMTYTVVNRGSDRLPFGFGLHPWFRVPGDPRDVLIRIPASRRMEAEGRLPTGKLVPVEGTPYDLRQPTMLEGLELDDVYFGTNPASPPYFEWRDRGLRVSLAASHGFTHVVVYTPPGRPVFCIENQTCATDAHNLAARGFEREAHLQVVDPGRTARGSVEWRIRRVRSGKLPTNY
jgi:aldose 1-epimerase